MERRKQVFACYNFMKQKIVDFGEKIGGARKDLWIANGLTEEFLEEMNDAEKKAYCNRDNIWPLMNAKKQVEDGMDPFVAFWQRKMRVMSYNHARLKRNEEFSKSIYEYTKALRLYKERILKVKTKNDISDFYNEVREIFYKNNRRIPKWENCICVYSIILSEKKDLGYWEYNCKTTNFPYIKRKSGERKKSFVPPQLSHIEREGEDYRHGVNINACLWQKEFAFRAVEFGNWTSQKDRQYSLNYCFDALKDLAKVLNISDKDIAFGQTLALAFGARGISNASAHYEPMREVINLTKIHGAGCTAHEWFHAMDDKLAKFLKVTDGKLASETKDQHLLPESYKKLIKTIKYDTDGNETDYYKGSTMFGKNFAKEAYGYWNSNAEMLVRAFACYVKDCLGCKSDYLIAHADVYEFEFENQSICAIPQGEERELFNELFDQLFYDLKQIGFFHKREIKVEKRYAINSKHTKFDFSQYVNENLDGQMRFVL